MKVFFLLFSTLFIINFHFSQVIGGTGNSQMTPKIAEPSKLTPGSFKGDVNLFTGEYNSSFPLGTVSTPSGLNFTLTYNNSSSFIVGGNVQLTSGIPYGDGWNLNLPSISVETDVYNAFKLCEYKYENSGALLNPPLNYGDKAEDEGDVYWLSPEINIPGVVSGRAVFKYIDVSDFNTPVFVLNQFETFVEVRYKSGLHQWTVLLPDGTMYAFDVSVKSNRAPSNARTLFHEQGDLNVHTNLVSSQYVGNHISPSVVNSVMPKESYNVWYCTEISNKNYQSQNIAFEYEKYGGFNYFKEFQQPEYKRGINETSFRSTLPIEQDYTVYTDIMLKKITSIGLFGPIDELRLNYKTNLPILNSTSEIINFKSGIGAGRLDSLYSFIPVHSVLGDDNFSGWKRYNHARKVQNSEAMDPSNPYTRSGSYWRDFLSSSDELAFDHGFLESERINSPNLYAGDIYEIRTKVKREDASNMKMGNGTLDIAVVTGKLDATLSNPNGTGFIVGESVLGTTDYNYSRGIELYSTFNMALKWQMSYQEAAKQTSNFFVMPNIPSGYGGINIQIGPGNSDNSFNASSATSENIETISGSEYHFNSLWTYSFLNHEREFRSAATIPHNFGVGLPWSNLLPLAKSMTEINDQSNDLNVLLPYFDFWWTNVYEKSSANKPTKFDDKTYLDELELIRYSKNPFMLESVELYHMNGKYPDPNNDGFKLISKKQMEYKIEREALTENFDYPEYFEPFISGTKSQLKILLKAVREIPLDNTINDTSLIQTTFFNYSPFFPYTTDYTDALPYNGSKGRVLTSIIDPLGGITRIEYYPFVKNSYSTYFNYIYEAPLVCDQPSSNDYGLPNVVLVHPVVHFVTKNNENDFDLNANSNNEFSNKTEYVFDLTTYTGINKNLTYTSDNFKNRSHVITQKGFGKVRVYTSKLSSGERSYTDYIHYTNPSSGVNLEDYLYFGKLKLIKSFDHAGNLHNEKTYTYGNTLAFQNGYLRPNPYRSQMNYEEKFYDQLYHPYEYEDYYKNEILEVYHNWINPVDSSVNPILDGTGPEGYKFLNIPTFNGNMGVFESPKFLEFKEYNMLEDNGVLRHYLNSYFVKLVEETDKNYETMYSKNSVGVTNPHGPGVFVHDNPKGIGKTNPIGVVGNKDVELSLTLLSNNANTITSKLIDESPLSETILESTLNSTKLSASQKTSVLLKQDGLSNQIWKKILLLEKKYTPSQLLSLVDKQAYFSDEIQKALIDINHKNLAPKFFEALLLKNELLSNSVMLYLLNANSYVNDKSFTEIFSNQEHLTETILLKLVENSHLVTNSLPEILEKQLMTTPIYKKISDQATLSSDILATIIEQDVVYPSDEVLSYIVDRTQTISFENLKRIIADSDREIDENVVNKILVIHPEVDKQKEIKDILSNVNQLNKYCVNPLVVSRDYIETKTTYEYYEADYLGTTAGNGYKKLLAIEDIPNRSIPLHTFFGGAVDYRVIDKVYLKHQPSWQVFSKITTSPHLPDAYSEEQYYYTYDLKNRYDRYWFNYDILGADPKSQIKNYDGAQYPFKDTLGHSLAWHADYLSDYNDYAIPILPKFDAMVYSQEKNLRSLPFQKVVYTKNVGDKKPVVKTEYFHYDARVKMDIPNPLTKVELFFNGPECPILPPDPVQTPCETCIDYRREDADPYQLQLNLPYGYCLWEFEDGPSMGYYVCPSIYFETNPCVANATRIGCNPFQLPPMEENPGPQPFILWSTLLGNTLQLKETFIQVDTLELNTINSFGDKKMDQTNKNIMEFFAGSLDSEDQEHFRVDYKPLLPFDNLRTSKIEKRNTFLQPEIVENQVGLKTRYYYTVPEFQNNLNTNCPLDEFSFSSTSHKNIAQPVRVTQGYGRPDSIATIYEYNEYGLVSKVIQPSGHYMEYKFDGYLRLTNLIENGNRLLTRRSYNLWNKDSDLSFRERTQQNYVYSILYNEYRNDGTVLDTNQREIQKSFVDPLGREFASTRSYDNNYLYSGTIVYDNWSRIGKAHKSKAEILTEDSNLELKSDLSNTFMTNRYENTPKNRVVRSSNFDVNIDNVHTIKSEFQIANNVFVSCELDLSKEELRMITKNGNTSNFRFYRIRTLDQDDKEIIEYSNAFGQKVATLAYDNSNAKVVTLFTYDSYGNLIKVINPNKQISSYQYNMLGLLIRENTVDAGEKRFIYNKHLKVAYMQDQMHRDFKDQSNVSKPKFRIFSYDDFGKLYSQENATLAPREDIFVFKNTNIVEYNADQSQIEFLFKYDFSNKSTLSWLGSYETVFIGARVKRSFENAIRDNVSEKSWEYQNDGKLIASVSYSNQGLPIQRVEYSYNAEDQISRQVTSFHPTDINIGGSDMKLSQIDYTKYNYRGSLLEQKIDIGKDGTTEMQYNYEYDDLNRLKTVYAAQDAVNSLNGATKIAAYQYDNATGLLSFENHHLGSGSGNENIGVQSIEYLYDVRDRLKSLNSELLRYSLFYDGDTPPNEFDASILSSQNYNGNINGVKIDYRFNTTTNNPSNFEYGTVYGYKYDKLNRLTSADASIGDFIHDAAALQIQESHLIGDENYTYDKIGNIKTLQRYKKSSNPLLMADLEAFTYAYSTGNNKLITALGAPGTSNRSYTYDANGNLLTDNSKTLTSTTYGRACYTYDLVKNGESIHYLYDVNDLRIFKHTGVDAGDDATTRKEYTLKDVMNRDVATYNYETNTWSYNVYGNTLIARIERNIGNDKRIILREATFYLYDHLGNTRVTYQPEGAKGVFVTDMNGNTYLVTTPENRIIYAGDYYPYGKIIREFTEGEIERYLTTHHDRDQETGLDYRGARYYDSDIGRFLSIDPLARKYPSLSAYNYVAANPIIFVDTDGKDINIWYKVEKTNIETGEKYTTKAFYVYGSDETVPENDFVKATIQSIDYLRQNDVGYIKGTEINIISELMKYENKDVNISETNSLIDQHFKGSIDYNPKSALETTNGEKQNPALNLLHELGHGYGYIFNKKKFEERKEVKYPEYGSDADYHNAEEQYVIDSIETPAAVKLGLGIRNNHLGTPYITKGPFSTDKL